MTPMQLEQTIVDHLTPTMPMPVVSFAMAPDAVDTIGAQGLASVVYQGSQQEGKPPMTKRTMAVAVLLFSPNLPLLHQQLGIVYEAMAPTAIAGCSSIIIVDDSVVQLDSGIYHAQVSLEAVVV